MKSTTKNNRNQKTSNLPLSIGSGVRAAAKVVAAILGFHSYMSQERYVICRVEHTANGYLYHLVNLDTKEIRRTDILEPLSRKYGIGLYFDDVNHEQMDAMEVAALAPEATEKARIKAEKAEAERKRADEQAAIGRKRLAEILPHDAKATTTAGGVDNPDFIFCNVRFDSRNGMYRIQ